MRFSCEWEPYAKGMLLTAERLNEDFRLGRFLMENASARLSDGILSGLLTRVKEGVLYLEPGIFRLGGLAWLTRPVPVELPPPDKWMRLWLRRESDAREFSLTWLPEAEQPRDALCLCRLHFTSVGILNDSWVLSGKTPQGPEHWLSILEAAGSPQLEFAMAASLGARPTLLPCIQRALAPREPRNLRFWLLNGLFPLLDHFDSVSWQDALKSLARLLQPNKGEREQTHTQEKRINILY